MKKELSTKYNPSEVEQGKYDYWLKNGFFNSGDKSKEPFTIVIPPPNVTGKLHIGHSQDASIQDMIIRRKRMQGYDALWLPGMDHAGIATQAKVDQRLKEQGISRYDIGREEFLKVAWQWKDEYANHIKQQWGRLGLSLDFTKERFTLDEDMNKAVNKVFIDLYNKGFIYQGERIISWDSEARTALSNIEVDFKDINGAFYYFTYKFVNKKGGIVVATTRPETMFADQAIMVHPEDERYKDVVGEYCYIPNTDVKIPIITDSYVDKDFKTGAVKVTPAHDPNDFEVGKRHNLSMPLCMDESGIMNHMAFKYEGLDRFLCRNTLVKDLKEAGLLVKIEPTVHSVGHSERTGVIVEPRLSKQWFVKMDILSKQVLENDEYKFIPQRFVNTLNHWLDQIHDWCISRQLWWGHRIPAWYKGDEVIVSEECPGEGFVQDEDVLDTWFSSALWPFSTLGWPNDTEDFKRYYPTNVLVTGYDIIFFWVARMLFQGIEFTKQAPFKEILIHGLVRDSEGRKMSKSLNNGIDPMYVCDKYGTDSLRYFLNTNTAPGSDFRYDETKLESSWNYLNKLWNISRYIMLNSDNCTLLDLEKEDLNLPSKWILNKLNKVINEVDYYFDKYEFTEVAKIIYNFVWDDFASWYLEFSKVDLQMESSSTHDKNIIQNVLCYVLDKIIKMLHPYVPFITEEIYQNMPHPKGSIMVSDWPKASESFEFCNVSDFEMLQEMIVSIRNEKSKANKPLSTKINMIITCNKETKRVLEENILYIEKFTQPKELIIVEETNNIDNKVVIVLNRLTIYIDNSDLVDLEEVYNTLLAEKQKLENELDRSNKMLNNEKFISKAPQEKVDIEKQKLKEYQDNYDKVCAHLEQIKAQKDK